MESVQWEVWEVGREWVTVVEVALGSVAGGGKVARGVKEGRVR